MTARLLLALMLLALTFGAGCTTTAPEPVGQPATPVHEDPARQVLVTFTDRALSRAPFGAPGGYLRRGADYGTTAWSHGVGARIAERHRLRAVTEWPIMTLGVHCVVYAVDDARGLAEVIEALQRDADVDAAQPMSVFRVLATDPYQHLQRSIEGMNVERAHRAATGNGVRIAVVDTGVDLHHPDLAGQVAVHADLTGAPRLPAFDNDIHGTAVAGVIAALADNGEGIVGIAPQATLLAYRACWPLREGDAQAICNSLSLATALDSAIRARPQIINLSLSGPRDPLLEALLSAAIARGIVVIAAEPQTQTGEPALASGLDGVIRVRAAGDASGAAGDAALLAAPGADILTTFPHGTYNFVSGSSFAAANVTGLVALLLQAAPGLGPVEVRRALDAATLRDPATGAIAGIDACAALEHAGSPGRCDH